MTTALLFGAWVSLGAYFLGFFALRKPRSPLALVWAMACTGWPVAAARELHWLPNGLTVGLVVVGLVVGGLGLSVVLFYEMQQQRFIR